MKKKFTHFFFDNFNEILKMNNIINEKTRHLIIIDNSR